MDFYKLQIIGTIKDNYGTVTMKSKEKRENYFGEFDFAKEKKKGGRGIIFDQGKEYFTQYDLNGYELTENRERTFKGIRIMIGFYFLL